MWTFYTIFEFVGEGLGDRPWQHNLLLFQSFINIIIIPTHKSLPMDNAAHAHAKPGSISIGLIGCIMMIGAKPKSRQTNNNKNYR
jgi:hypothetical protein